MIFRQPSTKEKRLQKKVLDLESQLEAKERVIVVMQAEIDSLAAVVARDRQRIHAECAAYSRQQAEAEGNTDEFNRQGNGRGIPQFSER